MSNFNVLFNIGQDSVDTMMKELNEHSYLWDSVPLRTKASYKGYVPFKDNSDILLQFNDLNKLGKDEDILETMPYPAMYILHSFRKAVFAMMAEVEGERLGRAIITRLPSGGRILPHVDTECFAKYYDRYHICLQDNEDTYFRCGDEYFNPKHGDIFYFNNNIEHEIWNDGNCDRITFIIDIKKKSLFLPAQPKEIEDQIDSGSVSAHVPGSVEDKKDE
jgi:hypothetical protein